MKAILTIDGLLQEAIDTPGVNVELVRMQVTRFEPLLRILPRGNQKATLGVNQLIASSVVTIVSPHGAIVLNIPPDV